MVVLRPLFLSILAIGLLPCAVQAQSVPERDIEDVSLESLLDVQVNAASKYDQKAREAPASVTVITAEEIDRFGYRTLEEVLGSVRGFYLNSEWDVLSYAGVRGFTRLGDVNNRLLILLNGHTLNERASGLVSVDERLGLDLNAVERIEIIRGPGSALYGTGAVFAVVNVVTKDARALETARLTGEVGSYGELQGRASAGGSLGRKGSLVASGFWKSYPGQDVYFADYDEPATNSGVAEKRDWSRTFGTLVTAAYGGLSFQGLYAEDRRGMVMPTAGTIFNHARPRMTLSRGFGEVRYEHTLGDDRNVMVRAHYDDMGYSLTNAFDWDVFPLPVTPPEGADALIVEERAHSRALGGEAQFRWDTSPRNRLVVGAEVQHASVDAGSMVPDLALRLTAPAFTVRSFSGYAQDEYRLNPQLALTVGLRYDHYLDQSGATTPRAALVYAPSHLSAWKLLYGEAFRVPGLYERYSGARRGLFLAYSHLKPERMRTLEAVYERAIGRSLKGSATVYRYALSDLIDQVLDRERGLWVNENLGRVAANGVEFELNAQLKSGLRGYASYTYQRARDTREDHELLNAPRRTARAGASVPVLGRFFVVPVLRYESGRLSSPDDRTDAFATADVTFVAERLLGWMRLSVAVHNLFDARYEMPTGFGQRQGAIPQQGRSASFRTEVRF